MARPRSAKASQDDAAQASAAAANTNDPVEKETQEATATVSDTAQDPKVEKVGGDPEAVNPEREKPLEAAEFNSEKQENRLAAAEGDGGFDLHHDEKIEDATEVGAPRPQLEVTDTTDHRTVPEAEQRKGTGAPNANDEDLKAIESGELDSAGEAKNSGEAPLSATDASVVGSSAVRTQKSVGAIAKPEAPADQNKTAIAESPVASPHGERVVTFATPPRVAIVEPNAKDGSVLGVEGGVQTPGIQGGLISSVSGNGVTPGLETLDSGIIPDPTVAETDGTYMHSGAPNETFDNAVAPTDRLAHGAELNSAPLTAPEYEKTPYQGNGEHTATSQGSFGIAVAQHAQGAIVDEATMQAPTGEVFSKLYEHGNTFYCNRRLLEVTAPGSPFATPSYTILLAQGAVVSEAQAAAIMAQIEALNAQNEDGLKAAKQVQDDHDSAVAEQEKQRSA